MRGLRVVGLCEESNCEGKDGGWRQVLTQSSAAEGGGVMGAQSGSCATRRRSFYAKAPRVTDFPNLTY